jgi:hypothetical protein
VYENRKEGGGGEVDGSCTFKFKLKEQSPHAAVVISDLHPIIMFSLSLHPDQVDPNGLGEDEVLEPYHANRSHSSGNP